FADEPLPHLARAAECVLHLVEIDSEVAKRDMTRGQAVLERLAIVVLRLFRVECDAGKLVAVHAGRQHRCLAQPENWNWHHFAGFLHRRIEEAADGDGVVTFFSGLDHLVENAARCKAIHGNDGIVLQVHGAFVDAVDVDLGVRALDAVEMRGQRLSIIMQPVNWGAALPPYFHDAILATLSLWARPGWTRYYIATN